MQRKTVVTSIIEGKPVIITASCNKCQYFDAFPDTGECFRFPKVERKESDDWCGEFKPEEKGDENVNESKRGADESPDRSREEKAG